MGISCVISAISCVCLSSVQWMMGIEVRGEVQQLVYCKSLCGERVTSGGE